MDDIHDGLNSLFDPDNSCKYCRYHNIEDLYNDQNRAGGTCLEILDRQLLIHSFLGGTKITDAKLKINYCPMCGRKL